MVAGVQNTDCCHAADVNGGRYTDARPAPIRQSMPDVSGRILPPHSTYMIKGSAPNDYSPEGSVSTAFHELIARNFIYKTDS